MEKVGPQLVQTILHDSRSAAEHDQRHADHEDLSDALGVYLVHQKHEQTNDCQRRDRDADQKWNGVRNYNINTIKSNYLFLNHPALPICICHSRLDLESS
jgi:hypothetical protein